MLPNLESFKDGKQFLVIYIIVQLCCSKSARVKSNWVNFIIFVNNGEDCSKSIVQSVVATTRRNGTRSLLTSAKLTKGYLVVGIYKRTRQGALAALLLYLYKYKVVRATTMCFPHVHSPCVFLKATMLPTCALTSYF